MIRNSLAHNELPTAVGFVNTKPQRRSVSYMSSTINNREPMPGFSPFSYKSKINMKETSLWNKQTSPNPAGYGNFGPQSAPLNVPGQV